MKLGIRESVISAGVFGALLFALASVDPAVRLRLSDMTAGGGIGPWTHRASELGSALMMAAQAHSIEGAPLLVFATVGTVLTLFMLRS